MVYVVKWPDGRIRVWLDIDSLMDPALPSVTEKLKALPDNQLNLVSQALPNKFLLLHGARAFLRFLATKHREGKILLKVYGRIPSDQCANIVSALLGSFPLEGYYPIQCCSPDVVASQPIDSNALYLSAQRRIVENIGKHFSLGNFQGDLSEMYLALVDPQKKEFSPRRIRYLNRLLPVTYLLHRLIEEERFSQFEGVNSNIFKYDPENHEAYQRGASLLGRGQFVLTRQTIPKTPTGPRVAFADPVSSVIPQKPSHARSGFWDSPSSVETLGGKAETPRRHFL